MQQHVLREVGRRAQAATRRATIFGLATGVIRSPNSRTARSGAAESGR